MPEGKCPKCGALFVGWALTDRQQQTCPECGVTLDIVDDDSRPPEKQLPDPTEASPADPTMDNHQTNE